MRYEIRIEAKYTIFASNQFDARKKAIGCIYEDLREDNLEIEISEIEVSGGDF